MGPFALTLYKPTQGADRRLLTAAGFKDALAGETLGVWQLAFAGVSFSSGVASFNPWGSADVFAPSTATKSPLEIVRAGGEIHLVPTDVRKWLIRGRVSSSQWEDAAFQVFAAASTAQLIRSLVSEVASAEAVVFNGPPRLNLALPGNVFTQFTASGYEALQAAVAWVYENPQSTEQRHALFASEAARSLTRSEPIGFALSKVGRDILEGARFAFQLSQSDLSREAIKTQGDLRKAIADDTTKAADSTRTVAGAIAVAIATGVGLVAARSTTAAEPWVLASVAAIVSLYLLVVAASGWMHLSLQKKLRDQWRRRFYRFVPEDDYEAMVTEPAREAEIPYHVVGAIAVLVGVALMFLATTQLGTNRTEAQKEKGALKVVTPPPVPVLPTPPVILKKEPKPVADGDSNVPKKDEPVSSDAPSEGK